MTHGKRDLGAAARALRGEVRAKDPEAFLAALGVEFRRRPGRVECLCPAHGDRNPSCDVRVGKEGTLSWLCRSCGARGDAISFIQARRGCSFVDALKVLADLTGREDPTKQRKSGIRARDRKPAPPPLPRPPPVPTISDEAFHVIAETLLSLCPLNGERDGRDYMAARCVYADAVARGFGALPPPSRQGAVIAALGRELARLDGAWPVPIQELLILAGLATSKRPGLLWSEHRLLIPWRSPDGRLLTVQRRRLGPGGDPRYVFPSGRGPTHPFGAELFGALAVDDPHAEVIVTESAIEALSRAKMLRSESRHAVVLGAPSASSWTAIGWRPYLEGRDVAIAFNGDGAGDAGALRFAEAIGSYAGELTRERPAGAKDFNEVLAS